MKLFLRTLWLGFWRFVALMTLLVALDHLDVRPLPEWTVTVAAYAIHFGVTYLFARWIFKKRRPSVPQIILVAVTLIVWEVLLEALTLKLIIGNWSGLWHFSRQNVSIWILYAASVSLAGWEAHKRVLKFVEGLVG